MARPHSWLAGLIAIACCALSGPAQGLTGKALRDALHDSAADFWIYDDLQKGEQTARQTGKPLLVSFRCVP